MILMKLTGYSSGMTPREGYEDWFEVLSVSFIKPGKKLPKVPLEFRVFRNQDAMSAALFRLVSTGESVRHVFIDFLDDSGLYRSLFFHEVYVAAVQMSGPGTDRPTESVDFDAASSG